MIHIKEKLKQGSRRYEKEEETDGILEPYLAENLPFQNYQRIEKTKREKK